MEIEVKGYLTFRGTIGERVVALPGDEPITLRAFLAHLASTLEPDFSAQVFDAQTRALRPHVAVLLNGVHAPHLPERLDTLLQEGDRVAIFPPIAGGAG